MLASESHGATLDAPPGFWEASPASVENQNRKLKPPKSRARAPLRTGILTVLSRFPSRCRCRDVPQVGWIRIFGVGSEFPRARAGVRSVAASRAVAFCGCQVQSKTVAWQPGALGRHCQSSADRTRPCTPDSQDRGQPKPRPRGLFDRRNQSCMNREGRKFLPLSKRSSVSADL